MRTWMLALLLYAAVSVGGDRDTETSSRYVRRVVAAAERPIPLPDPGQPVERDTAARCCKTCTKGKPCGDTCIEKDDVCHRPRGCAC
jgi:hypothetical protein